MSPDAIDLIRKMLTVDPEKRITADKILCHRWLQVNETVLLKLVSSSFPFVYPAVIVVSKYWGLLNSVSGIF